MVEDRASQDTCREKPAMLRTFILTWDQFTAPTANPTIGELFTHYYEYARSYAVTHDEIAARYRRYFGPIRDMQASVLTPQHVQHWHRVIGEKFGKPTANHALRLLRTVYNYALRFNLYVGNNPASVVRAFHENSRERFVRPDEMPAFLKEIEKLPARSRDFFYLLLFTGARSSNVLAMRWEHINVADSIWAIPNSKNGDTLLIPLDMRALAALARRRRHAKNGWVFPGDRRDGHMAFPRRDWERLRAQFPELTAHDLRRTLGTWEINTGSTLEVVGKSLGHRSLESTRIYARLQLDPVRHAVKAVPAKAFMPAQYCASVSGLV